MCQYVAAAVSKNKVNISVKYTGFHKNKAIKMNIITLKHLPKDKFSPEAAD